MKKIYTVTFAHYGFVQVEAESKLDAYREVEGYGKEDISWSDDFEVTNIQEEIINNNCDLRKEMKKL